MKKLLFKLAGLGLLSISLAAGWFWMGIQTFADTPVLLSEQARDFDIPAGAGLVRVANKLAEEGVIDSARSFRWLARFEDAERSLQAGEYLIEPGMTAQEVLALFVNGKTRQYSLTVIEGWTFRQMLQALHQHEKIRPTLAGLDDQAIMQKLGHPDQHPEGRFLPDTYLFPVGTTDVAFLQRAYNAMQRVLDKAWQQRDDDAPLKNAYQALILASIVEKETAVEGERRQIAGVFSRRLKKRMRLQTDPTVIYGMGEKYNGNIRRRDLKRDTPYNTYTRHGLPPTPIALPSAKSVMAAVQPAPGDELYFVAKGDGSHHFSSSIKEHNRAVRQYQIYKRKKDYRSTPEDNEKDNS